MKSKIVSNFLVNNPKVLDVLLKSLLVLPDYFDNKLKYHLELDEEYQILILNIIVDIDANKAFKKLKRFDKEWWLEKRFSTKGKLSFQLQFEEQ